MEFFVVAALFAQPAHALRPPGTPPPVQVGPANGPSECAGVEFKEDKFTHQLTSNVRASTSPNYVGGLLLKAQFSAAFDGGRVEMTIQVPSNGVRSEVFAAGYKVMLLLQDESVVELTTTEAVNPAVQTLGNVHTLWAVRLPLDRSQVTQLAAQPLSAMRTPLPGGDLTWLVGKGDAKAFGRAFTCFATLLP